MQPLQAAPRDEIHAQRVPTTSQGSPEQCGSMPCFPDSFGVVPTYLQEAVSQQSQSGLTRRQRQRLRKKEMQGQSVAEVGSNVSNTCEVAEEGAKDSIAQELGSSVISQVQSCLRNMLTRTFADLRKEFQTQVLIWSSMPRSSTAGHAELGVVVHGRPEAHMHTVINACLQLASADPVLAAATAELIVQQAAWDESVLSSAMVRAMQAVLAAKTKSDSLTRLPQSSLSTGRPAKNALRDQTPAETSEIQALIAACKLEECDTGLVLRTFGIPEDCKEPRRRITDTSTRNKHLERIRAQPKTLSRVKVKVKNTFVEGYDSSDDPDGPRSCSCSGSSVRSMSVPTRPGTPCIDSD